MRFVKFGIAAFAAVIMFGAAVGVGNADDGHAPSSTLALATDADHGDVTHRAGVPGHMGAIVGNGGGFYAASLGGYYHAVSAAYAGRTTESDPPPLPLCERSVVGYYDRDSGEAVGSSDGWNLFTEKIGGRWYQSERGEAATACRQDN